VDADHHDLVASEFLEPGVVDWKVVYTVDAPDGPEVQDYDLAAEFSKSQRAGIDPILDSGYFRGVDRDVLHLVEVECRAQQLIEAATLTIAENGKGFFLDRFQARAIRLGRIGLRHQLRQFVFLRWSHC
jgi:hypothetical protein